MFLGFYDYTVWLTYISLATSVYGIIAALRGETALAVLCLALSGFFDTFDGKVARTKKNRTVMQKNFGIQIDSLSDIVCFGVGPAVIAYSEGLTDALSLGILLAFCVAGLIRLAYFNVTEEERQKETAENRKFYQGLPITSSSILVPVYYMAAQIWDFDHFLGWRILMGAMGLLFILKIKVRKPGIKALAFIGLVMLGFAAYFVYVMLQRGRMS